MKNNKAILTRTDSGTRQTLGKLELFDNKKLVFECKTLELPWLGNLRNKSCIPVGEYKVSRHRSPNFGETFHVQDVPGRSEILIHKGNFNHNTRGCILPGLNFADINRDGLLDVTSSAAAMAALLEKAPVTFMLTIQ